MLGGDVVDYCPALPLVGHSVACPEHPGDFRIRFHIQDYRKDVFGSRGKSDRVTIASKVDGVARLYQAVDPIQSADACLPYGKTSALGRFESGRRSSAIFLPVNTREPAQHPVTFPHLIKPVNLLRAITKFAELGRVE